MFPIGLGSLAIPFVLLALPGSVTRQQLLLSLSVFLLSGNTIADCVERSGEQAESWRVGPAQL